MPWLTDLHFFISFRPGAYICAQVSIPECHGRRTCIFLFFFPDRCIHPCPSEHSRIPLPTDLFFFISFQAGASICVPVSIPECHCRRTCIFLFFFRTGASIHVPVSIPESHCQRTSFFFI